MVLDHGIFDTIKVNLFQSIEKDCHCGSLLTVHYSLYLVLILSEHI